MPRPIVPPEINQPDRRAPLIVGRDPGREESSRGRPFVGASGRLLFGGYDNLTEKQIHGVVSGSGWTREDVNITNRVLRQPWNNDFYRHSWEDIEDGKRQLLKLIEELNPSCIIATGAQAAYDLVPNWPTLTDKKPGDWSGGKTIKSAKDIIDRRGFFWYPGEHDLPFDGPVIATLHPASCLYQPMPNRMLLELDFQRAGAEQRGELPRTLWPGYKRIFSEGDLAPLFSSSLVAYDIEIKYDGSFLCIAFYSIEGHAFLAYADALGACVKFLESDVPKLCHNGQFDRYYLRARYDIEPGGYHEDTIVGHWSCFAEGQYVQMADGTRKWVEDLAVGDRIIAFDEYPEDSTYGRRRWQVAEVQARNFSTEEVFKITCEDGSWLTVTADHPVLTECDNPKQCRKWKPASKLRRNFSNLSYLYEPVEMDPHDAGYLAGVFDGEGSVSTGRVGQAGIHLVVCYQNENKVLAKTKHLLKKYGFEFSLKGSSKTKYIQLLGGLTAILRFLASVRPERAHRILDMLPRYGMKHTKKKVVSIESLGKQTIVQLKTSTSTLIVNGFAAHNCYPELAGKKETGREAQRKSNQMTRKGLLFLNSMHLNVGWHKTYTSDPHLMGELCVYDCASTMWNWEIIDKELDELGVRKQYTRQIRKLPALISVQERGMLIDEEMRRRRILALRSRKQKLAAEASDAALTFIKKHHITHRDDGTEYPWYHAGRCPCCMGGSKIASHCHRCAGIEGTGANGSLVMSDLRLYAWRTGMSREDAHALKKDELIELIPPCQVCDGVGKIDTWDLNIMSGPQLKEIIWNFAEAPKYLYRGSPNAQEDTMKKVLEWAEDR